MDFYGILFDMKNGKKIPYSKNYFDTMFAAKLEELGVKTLTGALPLTFTTSETALRSWIIYGNNTQHSYSAEGTLPLTFTTHTAGAADDWTIYGNDDNGTENLFDIPDSTSIGYNNYYASAVLSADVKSTISSYLNQHIDEEFSWYVDIDTIYTGSYYFSIVLFYEDGTHQAFQTTRHFIPSKTVVNIEMRVVYNNAEGVGLQYTFKNITIVKGSTAPDHYIPYQQGVGERTAQLFTDTVGKQVITAAAGTTLSTGINNPMTFAAGRYTIHYYQSTSMTSNTRNTLSFLTVATGVQTYESGSTNHHLDAGWYSWTFDIPNDGIYQMRIWINNASDEVKVTNFILTKGETATPTEYIPYGYQIPLIVSQQGQTDKTVDIYIGDSPLTEGETVSKTSTGVDIELFEGENTITTSLYNKPEMSITGLDYVGVGRPRGQDWEMRLVCVGELLPYKPNAPESDTSYVYNATDYTLDTDSRYKTALIEIGKEHQKIFTIGKTKGETFTIQPLDYMAEWGGVDHYNQIGQTITPTEETYTGETAAQYLLVTYYDSEVDTLTPKEIRESITLTATVDANTIIPIDAPLTEGQSVSKESTGVDIETFQHANNTLMEYAIESSNIEMSITYKGG